MSSAGKRLFILAVVICLLLSVSAFAAEGKRKLIGGASNIVPGSVAVGPMGKRFTAVIEDPATKKRRIVVNCKKLPGVYDQVAKGTPIFSPNGSRLAFVASHRGKCFVVVDGKEGPHYEVTSDRWPVSDLVFSHSSRHIAYKTRRKGKNYLMVNGKEFGPYDDVASKDGSKVPGIRDFQFAEDDNFFSYRAKISNGMVACRGWIQGGNIQLTTSKKYETTGAGTPVWLRGKSGEKGHEFAFIARENKKEFIAILPEPKAQNKKPKMYDFIRRHSPICNPSHIPGFLARSDKKWRVVIGDNEWQPCEAVGQLMNSPSGNRWACTAQIKGKIVMLVDGSPGPGYSGIRYPRTVFAARDERVIYAAAKDGKSVVVIDGKESEPYPEVDGGSILCAPGSQRMAYVVGDGKKYCVVLDGWKGPVFPRVSGLRFDPPGKRFAYRAQDGLKHYVIVDGQIMGPYEAVAPGSPVFSPDGRVAAWAAMGDDGNWRVYVDGEPGPAFDSIVSRLTFPPKSHDPVYIARILSRGKYSFAMVSDAQAGRQYASIWMGDGGRLFVRDDGRVECFARRGPLVYSIGTAKETDEKVTPAPSAARISLPANRAWLKGDSSSRQGEAIKRWNDNTQTRWDFICPADGTYELFLSYACGKDAAGSEFAVDIAGQSFPGKVRDTGADNRSARFSVGKVPLKTGQTYSIIVRLTKRVKHGMNLSSVELAGKKGLSKTGQ
jgi:hypothetical protein